MGPDLLLGDTEEGRTLFLFLSFFTVQKSNKSIISAQKGDKNTLKLSSG